MQRLLTRDLIRDPEIIFPAFTRKVPAAVVYSNAAEIGLRHFLNVMTQRTYLPYRAPFDPVMIGRLPDDTRLLGGNSYWVETAGCLAAEQINPLTPDVAATFTALRDLPFPTEFIDAPCLLVARYGDVTWGHWVAEILPRAILAEHAYPGRFLYAVGAHVTSADAVGSYAGRILESLAAYGIGEDRILKLRLDRHYQFSNLHAVTGIWSAGGMNPLVMRVMREALSPPSSHSNGRLAMLRRDAPTRNIVNGDEMIDVMTSHDFTIVDMADRPFLNQVALFRDSHTIFGVLGSGLIGLIYAPEGVKVASVAPGAWEDTYFYNLIQLRGGWHADIRGPTLWTGAGLERDAPLLAIRAHVQAGLAALAMPEALRAPDGTVNIGGTMLHRELGETLLTIEFGATGLGPALLGEGWSTPEPHHTWSIGPRSTMHIPLPFETEDLELQIDVLALTAPDFLPARKLDIFLGETLLGAFSVTDRATVSCALPASALRNISMLDIAFEHPFCVSARATGHAPDDRPLGIGFLALRIVKYT